MALNTVSSDRLSTNVKNTNFTSAEKQDLTDDIKPLLGSSGGGSKNKIINGAMLVAQRGTSSTISGYGTVDRSALVHAGVDEAPTQEQADVAAGTSPYTNGFRKCFKITNGNQTSGAGAADFIWYRYKIEAQDLANSGWNYTSSSSNITLSFWIKSSVAQTFKGYLKTLDGTQYGYPFETGSLTADTWTKVTKIIPGNSNLTFDNNNDQGMQINILGFMGTDYTDNSVTEDAWSTYGGAVRTKDQTSTWYTTNNATLEITGLQLEVGNVATDFDHRTFGQELALCQRYYYAPFPLNSATTALCVNGPYTTSQSFGVIQFPTTMRAVPSGDITMSSSYITLYTPEATSGRACSTLQVQELTKNSSRLYFTGYASNFGDAKGGAGYAMVANNSFKLAFDAEL